MTCVVAIKTKNKIIIGADSASADNNYSIIGRKDKKIFKKQNMVFAFSGSFRMGQIIQFSMKIPKHDRKKSDFEYICTDIISSIQKAFKTNGFDGEDEHKRKENDGLLIIIYNKNIYVIDCDFQVALYETSYASIGSGSDIAMGSLYTTECLGNIEPKNRAELALLASAKFCTAVREPFYIIEV